MDTLASAIESVAARARRYGERRLGEQNTKATLVEPMLEALGWDIRDPDEVHREYRPTGKDSPVDYALKLRRKPRLFLEAKGLGETLTDRRWIAQVLGYAIVAGVEWCVLTDGNEYCFFNATAPVDAEEKLLCRVRLADATLEEASRILSLMSRANLEQNLLDVLWVSNFVDRRVNAALRDILATPSRSIVRLVMQRAPKLSAKQIAESIRRLDIRIESPPAMPAAAAPQVKAAKRGAKKRKRSSRRTPTAYSVSLLDLISAGVLKPPVRLHRRYNGQEVEATLLPDGQVEFRGTAYSSCSAAAEAARAAVSGRKMNTNGWSFWQHADAAGTLTTLEATRRRYMEQRSEGAGGAAGLRLSGGSGASRSA